MQQQSIMFEDDRGDDQKYLWRPPEPGDLPFLKGVTRLGMDTENDSVNPFTANVAGISLAWRNPDNLNIEKIYAPVGHIEGNMDPEVVKSWLNYVLEGKEIIFANAKYDIPILKRFGVDLERLNVKPRDVAFPAALLDDSPYIDLSLEGIARRYVGRGKMEFEGDKNRIATYPSWFVAAYGMEDSVLNVEADEAMTPLIDTEGLDKVLELENSIIYAVIDIENNGCRLDVDKLHRWRREVRDEYEQIVLEIKRRTGMLISPGSPQDMARLFHELGVPPPIKVEPPPKKGKGRKTEEPPKKPKKEQARAYEVEELINLKHPIFDLVVEARRRESLLSKFLDKYADGLQGDLLRAQFHQLKTSRGEDEKGNKGVGWGRFSSSGGGDLNSGYTFNAQQVIRADKQVAELGEFHIIRELFIPDDGAEWGTADAKQIEYRIFATLAKAKMIIDAYKNDPDTDYHELVHKPLRLIKPHIDRTTVKNVNFGFAFGASAKTQAKTAGISVKEAEEINAFCQTLLPERDPFLNKCAYEAEHRGYVSTILGRRARFKKDDPFYKAVNRVVQGSAADIFKMGLRDLYKEKSTLGITKLRQIVHDEFNFDKQPGEIYSKRILDFLDQQRIDLKIPIHWELHTGPNWKECK